MVATVDIILGITQSSTVAGGGGVGGATRRASVVIGAGQSQSGRGGQKGQRAEKRKSDKHKSSPENNRLTKTGAVAGKRDVIKSVQKFLRRLKQAADKKLLNKSK